MKKLTLYLAVAVYCVLTAPSFALVTYSFTGITNNDPGDVAIGEAQLFVDLTDEGGGQVLFTFRNEGPEDSSIARIYFDDGTLDSLASIDNSDPGVDFESGGSPGNLPGGNEVDPPFVATTELTATSSPPTQPNGVNPGESVGLLFNLESGATFDDVVSALASGDLRIGIHVIGFASGGSEAFINVPVIPAPGAIVLGSIGSLAVAALRTIKNRKK